MKHNLTINKEVDGDTVKYLLDGAINVATAPLLENDLRRSLNGVKTLIFDFSKVSILTSAGIRVLFTANKVMKKQGKMMIINCNEIIKNVFYVTGLSNDFNIKD